MGERINDVQPSDVDNYLPGAGQVAVWIVNGWLVHLEQERQSSAIVRRVRVSDRADSCYYFTQSGSPPVLDGVWNGLLSDSELQTLCTSINRASSTLESVLIGESRTIESDMRFPQCSIVFD